MKEMTLTAHSGAFDTPINSLEFVQTAIKKKPQIIELDITFRSDNTAVMIHKGRPTKTEGVPFAEALELLKDAPGIRLNIDLKATRDLPGLEKLLAEYNMTDRCFYTGVTRGWIDKVRSTGTLPYYLNTDIPERFRKSERALTTLARRIKSLGAVGLNTNYRNLTPEVVEVLHREGVDVSVWTVCDIETARWVLDCGPDNITSANPEVVEKAIKERKK